MKNPSVSLPIATLVFLAATAAACASDSPTANVPGPSLEVTEQAGVVFMTQNVIPEETMDALHQGRVVEDGDGCLRLESQDEHTVVWPQGWTLAVTVEGAVVRDRDGAEVGRIGEAFALPGGEVTELSDAMGFTAEDRAAAERCPGRYWIAG